MREKDHPMSEQTEAERFIPHGSRCEADDGRGSDFGRCDRSAVAYVADGRVDRLVCAFHQKHWPSCASCAALEERIEKLEEQFENYKRSSSNHYAAAANERDSLQAAKDTADEKLKHVSRVLTVMENDLRSRLEAAERERDGALRLIQDAHKALDCIGAPLEDGVGLLTLAGRCEELSTRWAGEQQAAESSLTALRSQISGLVEWADSPSRETFRHMHKDDGVHYTPYRVMAAKLASLLACIGTQTEENKEDQSRVDRRS